MTQESSRSGIKYLIYEDLIPGLAEVASLGYKPRKYGGEGDQRGGLGWAANFIIRQFTQDAIDLLSRNCTEVAKFRFKMSGFNFEIKVTAPTGSPEAEAGLVIDPRSLFSGAVMQATLEAPTAPTSAPPAKQLAPATRENPKIAFMDDMFS